MTLPEYHEEMRKLEQQLSDEAAVARGVAVDDGQSIQTHKTVGKVADLKAILPASVQGTLGIAHTRWATHGDRSHKPAAAQQLVRRPTRLSVHSAGLSLTAARTRRR